MAPQSSPLLPISLRDRHHPRNPTIQNGRAQHTRFNTFHAKLAALLRNFMRISPLFHKQAIG
jgi:hypothetical protein